MKKNSNGKNVLIADGKDPFFSSSQISIFLFSLENLFIYTPNLLSFWFVVMRKNVRVTGSSAMFVVKIFGNDITWRVTWQPIKTEKKKRAWQMWMWTWVWILTKKFIIDYYARSVQEHSSPWRVLWKNNNTNNYARLLFFIVSSLVFLVNGALYKASFVFLIVCKRRVGMRALICDICLCFGLSGSQGLL